MLTHSAGVTRVDEATDGGPECLDGARGLPSQERLELGEGVLDRIEVGAVRRQVAQLGACRLDQIAHARPLVTGQVVHDDDVAWVKLRDQDPIDPGLEDVAVDRAVDDERGDDAAVAQAGDEGGGLPMAMRHAHPQPLAARATAVATGHVGAGPTLVDEHQPVGFEVDLTLEPGPAPAQHIGAVLLGGMRGLFLRVSRRRAKKRHSVP